MGNNKWRIEEIGSLIERIYCAAITEKNLQAIASELQRVVGTDHVNLLLIQPERLILEGGCASLPEAERLRYLRDWADRDDLMHALLQRPRNASITVATLDDLVSKQALRDSPVFEGFYEPNGIIHQCWALFAIGNGMYGGISLQNGHRAGTFQPEQLQLLEHLAGHVCWAMRTAEQIQMLTNRVAAAERVLTHWGVALLRCGPEASVLHASDGFAGLLERFYAALRLEGQCLHPTNGAVRTRLLRTLAGTPDGHTSSGQTMTLTPPGERPALECTVMPWSATEGVVTSDERLILLRESGQPSAVDAYVLRYRLGVTPTESHVLAKLMMGAGIPDIAEGRGSTVETVRSYLKSLRRKLRCNSQRELIANGWQALGLIPSAGVSSAELAR